MHMNALSKHYLSAQIFRQIGVLSLLLVLCMHIWAQPQSLGQGVYTIFNDYARTHWKSADSIEQVLDNISYYPKWKREDLKESINYLQSRKDYVYFTDSERCYFDGNLCTFSLPKRVQPCELMTDTSTEAFFEKSKVVSVGFDENGHVVYAALPFVESCVSKLKKKLQQSKSYNSSDERTWIPLVVDRVSNSVQNFCTQEYLDTNLHVMILQYIQAIWEQYPNVAEVRFGLYLPSAD